MIWLVIFGIYIIYCIVKAIVDARKRTNTSNNRTTSTSNTSINNTHRNETVNKTYRPSINKRGNIKFSEFSSSDTITGASDTKIDLSGLRDAFTGAPLNPTLGIYKCTNCSVFYHQQSYQVLTEENQGRCISCSSTKIIAVNTKSDTQGRNFNPDCVTLSNYHRHAGRVVTFQGYVHNVLVSRRGSDYAVMFENASWVKGFKLVFFRGTINAIGGKKYIMGLKGKTLQVRGLITYHQRYGYEIIISEPSMILDVR